MMFENGVLRKVFGSELEEVAGGWRRLHNEELHNLYTSPYVMRVIKLRSMRLTGLVTCMGEMRNAYSILVGKLEGKRLFGIPWHRSGGNIKIYNEVFSDYQPGKVVQFCRNQRFEDHLCPRPQGC
jgi:hypothetical protein